jgi:signal transduction histidine kinase
MVRRHEAQSRGIQVEATLAAAPITGDPSLVESLIANLVDNALRHNVDGGRVEVATETREGCAVLSVVNTGPMVAPEDVERLFEPFRRLGADRMSGKDGHGLGLSIVQAVADAHGATITVDPQPNGGLKVEVSFPELSSVPSGLALVDSSGKTASRQ